MPKRNRTWPFGLTFSGLLLKGKHREMAQAHYELTGDDLELEELRIEHGENSFEYRAKNAEILLNSANAEQFSEKRKLELEMDMQQDKTTDEYRLLELRMKFLNGEISDNAYAKEIATMNNEPWITYINCELDESEAGVGFSFEFDWNDAFISKLKQNGYEGVSDEDIVEKWYADLAKAVALEHIERSEFVDEVDEHIMQSNSLTQSTDLDDGRKEYK